MNCGASSQQMGQLRANQAQLLEKRREADTKDQQIRQDTDALVRMVDQRGQEARDRVLLQQELAAAAADHQDALALLREELAEQHTHNVREQRAHADAQAEDVLERSEAMLRPLAAGALSEADSELTAHLAQAKETHSSLIQGEEQLAARTQDELYSMRLEARLLAQERDSEAEAASVTQEAFLAEQRAAQRQGEMLTAEVRSQRSETDALQDAHRSLEGKAKLLQHELNKVSYTVGQRDHELKVKESELQEVRQSLASIQYEMDDVNGQLKEQCGRVQRVEGSLLLSRDLGEKVRAMRQMVEESHGGLAQLCANLEQERARREQCAQGLKQQRVRTELLLQLLHHFKSRTQDMVPSWSGGPETPLT